MKIVNSSTGTAYQLTPETQLEVDRTNPFFNDWGEQTLPVTLPGTELNRQLLGYPDQLANKNKIPNRIDVTIEDGDYFMNCRQAVLTATKRQGITTSFYMNEGSFYEKIKEVNLESIFGEEVIPGVSTVAQGIQFCKNLLNNTNAQFAIFPVYIDDEDGSKKWLNRLEYMDSEGKYTFTRPLPTNLTLGFYNEFDRKEKIGETTVTLDPGYYITPFIRVKYLLQRVFSYFGYQLQSSIFDSFPFSDMVFINNTIDTLVNKDIRLAHLVPDCMCTTFLEVFRKKFFCEFIPDEIHKTVTIQFFKDIITQKAKTDLSNCLTSEPEIEYPGYKQLKLTSQEVITDTNTFDSVPDLVSKFPTAYFNPVDGGYYRNGYSGTQRSIEKVGCCNIPYYAGGNLEITQIECPDTSFSLIYEEADPALISEGSADRPGTIAYIKKRGYLYLPYIGKSRALNSMLNIPADDPETTEETTETTNMNLNIELAPILAFVYKNSEGFCQGTNTNYKQDGTRISNYSLCYNGPDGIFERFFRDYDDLLRNSLHSVKAEFLLSQTQKRTIPSHLKIILKGQELFIDKLKYQLGGKNNPVESELLTTCLYEPTQHAISESERFSERKYKWKAVCESSDITEEEYNKSTLQEATLPAIYPPQPTKEQFDKGGKYYSRYTVHKIPSRQGGYYYSKYEYYLTPVTLDASDDPRSRG